MLRRRGSAAIAEASTSAGRLGNRDEPGGADARGSRATKGSFMVAHIVLFRPRTSLPDTERLAFIRAFETALRQVPDIRRVRIGRRVRHGRGYEDLMAEDMEHALVLEFDDVVGLRRYLEHPAHEEVGARFYASIAAGYVYDYEMRDEGALGDMLASSSS